MSTLGKKAEMGVGTLIIFVAMLLVAAIAAGVLITSVTSLQQKALSTGQETKAEISTHANFVEFKGEDGQDGNLENFSALIRVAAGSEPINLNDALITISLNDSTGNLRYAAGAPSTTNFNATYHVQGAEYQAGYLSRGDLVEINFEPPRTVIEDESFRVTFVPKIGTSSTLELRSPVVISRQLVFLYP